ncbi:hypothetical protein JZ751_021426 [Albula glossodonta]|uniref:Uncharacterized protein n=1 Tax=Albula glossodonta TaxID=121402 RepID=A0A8T2MRF0_9TELE|nr:hypothetical protein JZ751_021426 [Albula glossodonta]
MPTLTMTVLLHCSTLTIKWTKHIRGDAPNLCFSHTKLIPATLQSPKHHPKLLICQLLTR